MLWEEGCTARSWGETGLRTVSGTVVRSTALPRGVPWGVPWGVPRGVPRGVVWADVDSFAFTWQGRKACGDCFRYRQMP